MLGESCSNCYVPLMRNPAKTIHLCTHCGREDKIGRKVVSNGQDMQIKIDQTKKQILAERVEIVKVAEPSNAVAIAHQPMYAEVEEIQV